MATDCRSVLTGHVKKIGFGAEGECKAFGMSQLSRDEMGQVCDRAGLRRISSNQLGDPLRQDDDNFVACQFGAISQELRTRSMLKEIRQNIAEFLPQGCASVNRRMSGRAQRT